MSSSDQSPQTPCFVVGGLDVGTNDEYSDVEGLFGHLRTLDPSSHAYQKQRSLIIRRCLPLADNMARRYRDRGEPLDDLVQVARMGLLNAVNRFDLDTGTDFLSFAVPTITGEIRRHFRDHGWAVKVPRRIKDLQMQLKVASEELSRQLHRAPNASEIAEYLNMDRALIIDAMIAGSNYSVLSFDVSPRESDVQQALVETFGEIDPRLEKVLSVETVRPMIAALPERERTAIRLRFFDELTQSEIAERIGCSQMQVSRLLAKALHTLRTGAGPSCFAATG